MMAFARINPARKTQSLVIQARDICTNVSSYGDRRPSGLSLVGIEVLVLRDGRECTGLNRAKGHLELNRAS